jgi:hypothetical protein
MQNQALLDLIKFIEKISVDIKRLEVEGEALIGAEGQRAFQEKMEDKAERLAALSEDAWKLTEKVGGELGTEIARSLEQFSMSASAALRIGSVFFMTALLYPEDHQPGEPNDLEVLIEKLKGEI